MLDVAKMKEACRICARELCGNQRRWIFHPAAKLSLQVLLSHALGRELTRDGRGEFACSKCAFMLDRMYRFDTVIARVEALSLERLHKLLLEKDRLRQCIGGLYRKNNAEDCTGAPPSGAVVGTDVASEDPPVVDLSALQDGRYSVMVQDDLTYSEYESWADREDAMPDPPTHHHLQCPAADSVPGQKPRRCRGCAGLRVADSDYEAVCKVPRRIGRRSTSCGPSTRYSTATSGVEEPATVSGDSEATAVPFVPAVSTCDRTSPSPASSVESLHTAVDVSCLPVNQKDQEEPGAEKDPQEAPAGRDTTWDKDPSEGSVSGLETTLSLLRGWEYRPVRPQRGSKLPVLVKAKLEQGLLLSLSLSGPPMRSPCGGAVDCELYHHQQLVPEVVTPCPQAELAEMEEQWLDDYVQCGPFRFQQRLIAEQQGRLSQYEGAAGQCVGELQKAQDQVCSLQAKIRESETRNQKLQERLGEMELELRSAREEAQRQERSIQNITDTAQSKEAEVAELYQVVEEQNKMLCSLKELAHRSQLQVSGPDSVRGQGEVLALQGSLFQAQLELQAGQRAQQQASRTQEDLSRALGRLEEDLQGALQHRRDTERHNQDLQLALEKARSALQETEEQLRASEAERQRQDAEREKLVRELRAALQTKDQLMEDYCQPLEDPKEERDSLLQKLRQRIRERDRALERAVDDKFRSVEEKEEATRRLQLLLRERERDLERQRCVLANNEETIASLEVLLRGKALELEQVCGAWRSVQRQHHEDEQRQSGVLAERDAIIGQLQAALHARTQEAQDLRCSLLAPIQSAPNDVLEELKVRLQLKDRLFQEVLADRTQQAQQHHKQVQDLLRTISSRDQYIQECAGRLSEVMGEQTGRLQELRRQLSFGSGSGSGSGSGPDAVLELQAVQDELRLALRREAESRELSRSQAARVDALSTTLHVKDQIIRDFQRQMVEPSGLPLVEQLTREVQELRETLIQQQDGPPARGPVPGLARPNGTQPGFGELSSEDEDEADDDLNSECTESVDEDESRLRVRSLANTEGRGGPGKAWSQDQVFERQGLMEVKQLVEQKRAVERELGELKAQLEKAGFSSLSQMRKALYSLQAEIGDLKHRLAGGLQPDAKHSAGQQLSDDEDEEEELDVTIEGVEEDEEEISEMWDAWDGELGEEQRADRPETLPESSQDVVDSERPAGPQQDAVSSLDSVKTVRLQQESRELQERLMVSEATVQAQAEQLKDYRELLTETAVQQDSKQIQVDLQDLGYETCGRSENEAEREDTSSPEFDDLEMCTSLDCGSQWWPANTSSSCTSTKGTPQGSGDGDEMSSLQRLVEDLRSQLSRSQTVIRGLQSRLRSISTSSDHAPSTPRKVNWSFQASEDDEGWQSSDGGPLASPCHPHPNRGLQELASRVDALEDQLRKGGNKSIKEDVKSATWPGKFDTLIQAQARELSHLRQRLREGRGVCSILTQHLGDTTKAFEELLRANDIDYYMGQSFREQLAQSGALAQRVAAKISGRDHAEDPDEKTELLAIRLSKELQQKDKVIESLRSKLNQHHHHDPHPPRSDTPCSSHALSDTTDQSDRISYVSDEHGSTNGELDPGSDADAVSELGQKDTRSSTRVSTGSHAHSASTMSHHPSVPPSITSSIHTAPSCLSCPSMHCPSSLHKPTADVQSHAGFSSPQSRPLQGVPLAQQQHPPDPHAFLPLSHHGYQASPFASGLDAGAALKAGAGLLESSALWDMSYGNRAARLGADLSSGSSGYQSGTSNTGSDLMKEHLREIRGLRQRLEDSIQTNDRLRQQLEDRLARTATEKGAPTNIYIQGLDSAGQLSTEIRLLKEENLSLQNQLKQAAREGTKEAEHLKKAELEAERWAEQSRKLQAETEARRHEITQLKQDRQKNQEAINRLQHEVSVVQQQLCESRSLVLSLQCELQVQCRVCEVHTNTHAGQAGKEAKHGHSAATFDPRELPVQLEQQLTGQADTQPRSRRQLFTAASTLQGPAPVPAASTLQGPAPVPAASSTLQGPAPVPAASTLQGPAPGGSSANRHGGHAVGHIEDFEALQQQILQGGALLRKMETAVNSLSGPQELSLHQPPDSGSIRTLMSDTTSLRQILEEADSLLRVFWRAGLQDHEDAKQDPSLREEVVSLRLRLSEREQALQDAMERVQSSNRTKDSMEHFIVHQLSRTRDVLSKAKTNLQVKTQEVSVSSPYLLVGVS